jgi:nicotinate-nucleotide--dimethylbenzimidazole phosphoribosyltransferase
MTGTDEFGHELDAQGYERAPGQAPLGGTPRQRGPQPVGRPTQGQLPGRPLPPNPAMPGMLGQQQPAAQDSPWLAAAPDAPVPGYPEPAAFAAVPQPNPAMPGMMPVEMEIDATAPQPRLVMPAPGPGHDAPTAEFYPLYDAGSPEDYQVPPAAVPAPQPVAPQQQMPPRQPTPTTEVPVQRPASPLSGVSVGPIPPQATAPAAPYQQQPQQPQSQEGEEHGGYPEQPQSPQQQPEFEPLSASASWAAPPLQAPVRPAQAQRPAVPAQPMPTPAPLPERGAARSGVRSTGGGIAAAGAVAAGRAAVRQQQADAAAQTEGDPLASSGQRTVPAQAQAPQAPSVFDPVVPQQQPQPQPEQYQPSQTQAADPGASGVRDTMAPPRRRVGPQPPQAAAAPAPAAVPVPAPSSPDDLSSANLRSVAPAVPAPRRVPEDSAGDLPPLPPRPAKQEPAQDNDELVVPWGAAAQQSNAEQGPRGTRRRETSADDVVPEALSAPMPVLLDPEPGEDDDFAARSGSYQQPQDAAEEDPLSGSGAHARPQQQTPAPAEQPQSQQQPQVPQQQVPAPQQPQEAQQVQPEPEQPKAQPQQPVQQQPVQQNVQAQPVQQPQAQPVQPQPQSQPVQQQPQAQPAEPVQQPQPIPPKAQPAQPVQQVQPQTQPARQQAQAQPVQPKTQQQPTQPQQQPVQQPQPQSAQQPQPVQPKTQPQPAQQQPQAQPVQPQQPPMIQQPRQVQPEPAEQTVVEQAPAPKPVKQPASPKPAKKAAAPAPVAAEVEGEDGDRAPGYGEAEMEAVYRVIHERRDIRNDFLPDELPIDVLTRILEAAHTAPSVGFSQPWDFLVLRDEERRRAVHDLAVRQRKAYAASLPKARAKAFAALKIEAILDTPVNIVVTCDPTRGGRHTLGRYTQPMMAPFSTCLAVENLWLAARAEGLGVGWVSFFDERELSETLGLPEHLQIVAYLCVGYVKRFPSEPELAGAGWARRRPLSWAVHEEDYGRRAMPGGDPVSLLDATVDAVRGLDEDAAAAARDRQGRMTKPPGSLGMLEHVAEQLSGLAGECPPPMPEPAALAVFAADHGVHAQGVTPWPQEVTAQMVSNFLSGGAVVNAFAKQVGAEVCVVDVGVNANLGNASGLVPRKVRFGTADMTQGPAMSRDEAMAAIEAGIETARDLVAAGNRCLLTGDMGIANTTASAALIAAFTGASPAQVTGYGTGIDEQTYAHKVEIVRRALELHRPDPQDPIGVLAAFGGLEHAALAGFILGGAALRIPVVLDGVIAGAAALVAQAIAPEVTVACVAGHRSAEPGHALALEALGINPLIDLELRLGEGSGAVLALPLVAAAIRALREVATFDAAGVADASAAAVAPRGRE